MGRRPSARLKADEAAKLFKAGRTVTQIANALGIGRGSVYRALETCGIEQRQVGHQPTEENERSRRSGLAQASGLYRPAQSGSSRIYLAASAAALAPSAARETSACAQTLTS
jgi:Helix-turn-helix domain of resolvase